MLEQQINWEKPKNPLFPLFQRWSRPTFFLGWFLDPQIALSAPIYGWFQFGSHLIEFFWKGLCNDNDCDHRYEKLLEQWRQGLGFKNLNSTKSSILIYFKINEQRWFLKSIFGGQCGDRSGARWNSTRNCSIWRAAIQNSVPGCTEKFGHCSTIVGGLTIILIILLQ